MSQDIAIVQSKSFFKLPFVVNVAQLCKSLERNSDLFDQHPERRSAYSSPHNGMTDIWVRYNAYDRFGDGFNDEHVPVWYPCLRRIPQVLPVVFDIFQFVGGEMLGGVLITKLPAGGKIESHVDSGWHAGYYDKFYVPVKNAEGSVFCFEDGVIYPEIGSVYWFNNSVPHWVENNSNEDRISMIVCIRTMERSINELA